MLTPTPGTHSHAGTFLTLAMTAAVAWAVTGAGEGLAAGPGAASPQVEIKKHSTGKEATITYGDGEDRKSTRLNSSHVAISYAVFCLKKKKKKKKNTKRKKEKQ